MVNGRTVLVTLAGEIVGRYRIFDLGAGPGGRPLQPADLIAEAERRLRLQGASREDLERAEFTVLED